MENIIYLEDIKRIQNKIEDGEITPEKVLNIIKSLNENERQMLKELYIRQIQSYNTSIEKHKNKILKIRKKLNNK